MKDKIILLIIGALIGAIITAGVFLIYNNSNLKNQMMYNKDKVPFEEFEQNSMRQKGDRKNTNVIAEEDFPLDIPFDENQPNGETMQRPSEFGIDNKNI